MNVLYFGCLNRAGHHLHDKEDFHRQYGSTPWGNDLDGKFMLDALAPEGVCKFEQLQGWSGIGFCDRTIDGRPGSHSAFLVVGLVSPAELLEGARQQWPEVFRRLQFNIVLPGQEKA
jgi:hypothetical protein